MKKSILFVILIIALLVLLSPVLMAQAENDQHDISRGDIKELEFDGEIYLIRGYDNFEEQIQAVERPVVGLALSGGGARAIANLGILKALVENDIPIDLITGTSMGSIIGSLYSSGLSIEQIEEILTDLPFSSLFNFGIGGSLLNTKKLNIFMEEVIPNKSLENFLIPTAQLSFDLKEGKKFLIAEGNISEVLQATYSIPGYFPIHSEGEHYFMDAGILEPSPAKSAELMGADYVIATSTPEAEGTGDYSGAFQSSARFMQILQNQNSERILENHADFVIEADVKSYTFMDYNYANRLIEIGYNEAVKNIDKIKEELALLEKEPAQREERPYYDVDNLLRDVEFDRIIIEDSSINPIIYYGRDYSFFNQELIRTPLNNFQTGVNLKRNNLDLSLIGSDDWDKGYEAEFTITKLTDSLDYIIKYQNIYDQSHADNYENEIKYYGPRYNLSAGFGRRNDQDYMLFGSNFRYIGENFQWQTENDIFYLQDDSDFKLLTSQIINYDFTRTWSITAELVYNNTKIAESPIIYKGQDLDDLQPELQSSLHFNYNYNLQIPFQLLNFFQMTDIGAYLFADYYHEDDWKDGALAVGPAFNAKLYLLGLKPIELDLFAAHDFEVEDQRYGIQFSYKF
ncbi:MAG: patatin-like phospholipase family protein [Halanaerobium sp.]